MLGVIIVILLALLGGWQVGRVLHHYGEGRTLDAVFHAIVAVIIAMLEAAFLAGLLLG